MLTELVTTEAEQRALELCNPASGIANDFLNHFNEALLLIENLPVLLPEMVEELLSWRPRTYREYFQGSNLPGGPLALKIYESIEPDLRREFEARVDCVNKICGECVAVIRDHQDADGSITVADIEDYCAIASANLRAMLEDLACIVNTGEVGGSQCPQGQADQVLSGAAD